MNKRCYFGVAGILTMSFCLACDSPKNSRPDNADEPAAETSAGETSFDQGTPTSLPPAQKTDPPVGVETTEPRPPSQDSGAGSTTNGASDESVQDSSSDKSAMDTTAMDTMQMDSSSCEPNCASDPGSTSADKSGANPNICDALQLRLPPAPKGTPKSRFVLDTLLMNPQVFRLESGNAKQMIDLIEACLQGQP